MLAKLVDYLKESRQELLRVNWPTRKETIRLTSIVIGLSLCTALFLGLVDFLLTLALRNFLI